MCYIHELAHELAICHKYSVSLSVHTVQLLLPSVAQLADRIYCTGQVPVEKMCLLCLVNQPSLLLLSLLHGLLPFRLLRCSR